MTKHEALIEKTGKRARELFDSKQHNCAESTLIALNELFGGGLEPQTAARIATGLGGGLGASGGTCGALTGCVLALGLLAECDPDVLRKKTIYPLAANLQKRFIERFESCCCSDLIRGLGDERRAYCRGVTATAAALCAEMLLEHNSNKKE
jgi:C_GCAxxG_C_C family probable redox protein